jgi:hypothetical protein
MSINWSRLEKPAGQNIDSSDVSSSLVTRFRNREDSAQALAQALQAIL